MEYRQIGSTDMKVSVIGLGTWPMGGIDGGVIGESKKVQKLGWSGAVDEESMKTVRRAEELGVNFLHSSEAYGGGHAETVLGTALKGRRDRFIVATKVRPIMESGDVAAARQRIHEALEGSLRRLQTDYIDIHQLHSFPHKDTTAAVMEEYAKLQQQGKVRHLAISATDPERIRELKGLGDLVAIMFGQNLMTARDDETFDLAAQLNLGTVILSSLHQGVLAGQWFGKVPDIGPDDKRYSNFTSAGATKAFQVLKELEFLTEGGDRTMAQAAFRYLIDMPGVTSILTGALRPGQIEENVGALETRPLTATETERALAIAAEATKVWQG